MGIIIMATLIMTVKAEVSLSSPDQNGYNSGSAKIITRT
jgi:hypothetical protein